MLGVEVVSARAVGGGCIADAHRIELADGRVVFAKSGAGLPVGLLRVEAEGLRWLAEAGAVNIPQVVGLGRAGSGDGDAGELDDTELFSPGDDAQDREGLGGDVLLLEWIEPGSRQADTDHRLGAGLARLHQAGAPAFGWHRDGFIGSLPQANTPTADHDWPGFWFSRRIEPLARRGVDRGSLDPNAGRLVERLGARLGELSGPSEPPARVHGDLWSGNVLVGAGGEPWLIDPAAYGGHREVDLAMLHLFGNPGPGFIDAYQEVSPLAPGWRDRLKLWQLEPLLVHTALFGGAYGSQALAVLRHFA